MNNVESEIQAMVDRERAAWDALDAEALVSLFHPDMVWPWPPSADAHDPVNWVMPMGRFDHDRWKSEWDGLFRTHELVRNERTTARIVVSAEGDGAFAVVDIDTVWRSRETGEDAHWKGRTCKTYTKCDGRWLLIMHTGVLDYSSLRAEASS